jgi:LPS-assembly protein
MKNKITIIIALLFFSKNLLADRLEIEAKNISIEKDSQISIFEGEVIVKTEDGNSITSDYAKYNREKGFIELKNNVLAKDKKNNIIKSDYAIYTEKTQILKTEGPTSITTTENYNIDGNDITFDNISKFIRSDKKTIIEDVDKNRIFLDNFEYLIDNNIFKSIGLINIEDNLKNTYEFSQIYIDTKKKEILGTDIKLNLNSKDFKINKDNKPRILANTVQINENKKSFGKSIFTICDYRANDKCPPWTIQASKMLHDNKKKTIYYDNALIKVYNIPIFYFPRLSHPDPTVERRSGFLLPRYSDTKNLGSGLSVPYYYAISKDKDLTFTNYFYIDENPLFIGEYRQAFKNSNLTLDMGYTQGYKNTSATKKSGEKSHFFSNFVSLFKGKNNSENIFKFRTQDVSNDKYLKLYRINSDLVDYNQDILENYIDFSHNSDDIFLSANATIYENLKENYNDKYEYIFPEVTLDKNLFQNDTLGSLDLQSNFRVNNYDTNKTSKLLINDFNWKQNDHLFDSGLRGSLIGKFKNVNYETKNINSFKEDVTNELFGAIGYLAEIDLIKKNLKNFSESLFTPKILFRHSPGDMRKQNDGPALNALNAFSLDRLSNSEVLETGLSATIGFDYEMKKNNKKHNLSVAQIFNKKENKKMASKTSLDEKASDVVGTYNYKFSEKINFDYNFNIDQNYKDLNYSSIVSSLNFNPIKLDFNYVLEDKHIGDKEFLKSKISYDKGDKTRLSFEMKRNLITNSAEFYDLSYEYYNDCLRAGLVYRREFYEDSELETENALMFKITLVPFGNLDTPSINK